MFQPQCFMHHFYVLCLFSINARQCRLQVGGTPGVPRQVSAPPSDIGGWRSTGHRWNCRGCSWMMDRRWKRCSCCCHFSSRRCWRSASPSPSPPAKAVMKPCANWSAMPWKGLARHTPNQSAPPNNQPKATASIQRFVTYHCLFPTPGRKLLNTKQRVKR
jgi:hypothetical protein